MNINKKILSLTAVFGTGAIASAVAYGKHKQYKKQARLIDESIRDAYRLLKDISDITGTPLTLHKVGTPIASNLLIDNVTTNYLKEIAVLPIGYEVAIIDGTTPIDHDTDGGIEDGKCDK